MDKLVIEGGHRLEGTITISGAKNAALPLICSALLTEETVTFTNMPTTLSDVYSLKELLECHGASVNITPGSMTIQAANITNLVAPYEIVRKMRASILVLGPLLARFGKASVSYPGGCAIGVRPIDVTLEGLEAMGAEIILENGYINATAIGGHLKGCHYVLRVPSWTGTENLIMAAVLAKGTTILENVAREPEVEDLCNCLISMGAKIEGAGGSKITIHGVDSLKGTTHPVMTDRLEAGTYAVAAAMTGGKLFLDNTSTEYLGAAISLLEHTGTKIIPEANGFWVEGSGDLQPIDLITEPYPGLATDLQAQFMALSTVAKGTSVIKETIYENRFMHVPELNRMGANISIQGNVAVVRGVPLLHGAPVMATDLRASVALVLAGLVAEGETIVNRIYHLDRGYERLEEKLTSCGAKIRRVSGEA